MFWTDSTFSLGILIEDTFNRNSTLCYIRPYESPIFLIIQTGDISNMMGLLHSGHASIHDVDPYGLGLLYVRILSSPIQDYRPVINIDIQYAAYYCWKGLGGTTAMQICTQLIMIGANTDWVDDIGKYVLIPRAVWFMPESEGLIYPSTPIETMLDSALVYGAMSNDSTKQFGSQLEEISCLYGESPLELSRGYLSTRGFTPLHEVLLGINRGQTLEQFLCSSSQAGTLKSMINRADLHYRTALTWAVEFGWDNAVRVLLRYGADPHLPTWSGKGHSTLLHLVIAGSPLQFSNLGFRTIVRILVEAGIDINARDHEGWTPLHIAASWDLYTLCELLIHDGLDWSLLTNDGESVNDLSPDRGFTQKVLSSMTS